jgi:hypothetical protein
VRSSVISESFPSTTPRRLHANIADGRLWQRPHRDRYLGVAQLLPSRQTDPRLTREPSLTGAIGRTVQERYPYSSILFAVHLVLLLCILYDAQFRGWRCPYIVPRWAASISDWRPRRRAVVAALDVEVGSVVIQIMTKVDI